MRFLGLLLERRALVGALPLLLAHAAFGQGVPAIGFSTFGAAGGTASGGNVALVDSLGGTATGDASTGGTVAAAGFLPGALLDGDETWCALPAGMPAGSYTFHRTARVRVDIAATGTLGCLHVRRTEALPPNWVAGIETGRFWDLAGTDASGSTAAGFDVAITLPYAGTTADPRACRFAGTAWDCSRTSFDATTVTRSGVTQLSEWAVGDGLVPVGLLRFSIE